MINSHAKADEKEKIKYALPSAQLLKERGIKRVVLGKECFINMAARSI